MLKQIFLLALFGDSLVNCLRLTFASLPSHAILGDSVELACKYDLEGDRLYSVKWYRNGQEFYRYIPTDIPDTTVFPYPGLYVDEYKSSETKILLRRVDLNTSGKFRCEVSGEAPLFQTANSNNVLRVVDLPDSGPEISGSQPRYNTGDILSANCTSSNSFPAANLTWYINGEEATNKMLVKYPVKVVHIMNRPLQTSVLSLRLKVRERMFSKTGDIKIKCTAAIDSIYWRSNEESIQGYSGSQISQDRLWAWSSAAVPILSSCSSIFFVRELFLISSLWMLLQFL